MFTKSSNYNIFFTLPILSYIGYTFYMHLNNAIYMSFVDIVDFFIHEFGHILFGIPGNQFLLVAGGTLLQIIIPVFMLIYFLKQSDYFAMALCYFWVGTNFFYISTYSGDAIKMQLPLIGTGSGETIHDWFYMFTKLGVIQYTDFIAGVFYFIAILFYLLCFIYSFVLVMNRFREGKI